MLYDPDDLRNSVYQLLNRDIELNVDHVAEVLVGKRGEPHWLGNYIPGRQPRESDDDYHQRCFQAIVTLVTEVKERNVEQKFQRYDERIEEFVPVSEIKSQLYANLKPGFDAVFPKPEGYNPDSRDPLRHRAAIVSTMMQKLIGKEDIPDYEPDTLYNRLFTAERPQPLGNPSLNTMDNALQEAVTMHFARQVFDKLQKEIVDNAPQKMSATQKLSTMFKAPKSNKWSFTSNFGSSGFVKINGTTYNVPKRLASAYNALKSGLAEPVDYENFQEKLAEAADKVHSKVQDGFVGTNPKIERLYTDLDAELQETVKEAQTEAQAIQPGQTSR